MCEEEYPVELILDSIESMMTSLKQPKVLLFDIGGVCVVSPMQAILDYELSHNIPPGWVNNCISKSKPNGFWHRLERGELLMNADWFAGFSSDLHRQDLWQCFYTSLATKPSTTSQEIPSLPKVDAEYLFWEMMGASRAPDPWMYPALLSLKASGKHILAALSNTVIFPPSHPYSTASREISDIFDVFISSAHVGLRKPDPAIYDITLREIDKFSKENGKGGVEAGEVLFLDDIGENLKWGKRKGFQTIKVGLGRAFEAVDELEKVTGLQLAGSHPRIPVEPKISKARL